MDPLVFEDAKWDHESYTEVQGENVVYIRFNKGALTDEQVNTLEAEIEKLYVRRQFRDR